MPAFAQIASADPAATVTACRSTATLGVWLGNLGVSPVILRLIALAFNVSSWLDAGRSGHAFALRFGKNLGEKVATARHIRTPSAVITTAMVAAAQLATLWLVYIVGNLTSLFLSLDAPANGRLDTITAGSAEHLG